MRQILVAIGDQQVAPALPGAGDEVPGFRGIERQRLLAQHVRSGLDGIARLGIVMLVRRRDDDDVGLSRQQLAIVFGGEGKAKMIAHPRQLGGTEPADAIQHHLRPARQHRDMVFGPVPAGPDDGGLQLLFGQAWVSKVSAIHGCNVQSASLS